MFVKVLSTGLGKVVTSTEVDNMFDIYSVLIVAFNAP